MNLKSKPYYNILPPLFGNLKTKVLPEESENDISSLDIDKEKYQKLYKPICPIVDFENEEFEIIR